MRKSSQERIVYGAWKNMEYRCENPEHEYYHIYGGRGIKVCPEWKEFDSFLEWSISNGHEKGLSLERIDNDGDYEPSNCKWATIAEQNNNRSSITFITIDGTTKNAYEWCEVYDINYMTFLSRRNIYKWDEVKSLTTPVKRRSPKGFQKRIQ